MTRRSPTADPTGAPSTAGRINPFERGGQPYAQFRPTYPPQLAAALAALCCRTDHALDVGCGSGQLTMLLAAHFRATTGVDPSAEQLSHAPAHATVTYRNEGAERIGLDDRSVDLVVAAQAAHWFDLDAFYTEARRVARDDAVLALVTYGVHELSGPARDAFRHFYAETIHSFWPPARRHVEAAYRTLAFPFDEVDFPMFTIERDWPLANVVGYVETWSATKAARAAGEGRRVDDFITELAAIWGEATTTHRITWPIGARVAKIHAHAP